MTKTRADEEALLDITIPFFDIINPSDFYLSVLRLDIAHANIATSQDNFYPQSSTTRAEAYAMLMHSVCLYPQDNYDNWQQSIHSIAKQEGLTSYDWEDFRPNDPILRQEVFVLASRTADWAQETGACAQYVPVCD